MTSTMVEAERWSRPDDPESQEQETTPMKAVAHPHARPDLYRPGVGAVLVSTWRVGTPARQRAAVEAVRAVWERREWPDPGLLSYTVHTGADGDTLLHYSQWTDEAVYEDFVRTHRDDRNAEIDAAVPGVERVVLHRYAPPRPVAAPGTADGPPGALSVVEADFGGPGAGRREGPEEVVDAVLAGDPATRLAPGRIGTHVHRSTDGTRVLVLTEWESERALAGWRAEYAPPGGARRPARELPGLTGVRVRWYTPALSLGAGT
ncbi:antibiotic biosynthesis monooxygenase family protein [Streptomyces sp. NPDC001744]|uniref:antibiotic biosynthesis monooxygenase family protein n=1 Tax=Streptomyces sp. NPDC001744 TaxID=3364606 RepID=UPI0036C8A248